MTSPSTAASDVFASCATETIQLNIQTALIKLTDAAEHMVLRSLVFLIYLCYMDYFSLSQITAATHTSFSIHNEEIIFRIISKQFWLMSNPRHASSDQCSNITWHCGVRCLYQLHYRDNPIKVCSNSANISLPMAVHLVHVFRSLVF